MAIFFHKGNSMERILIKVLLFLIITFGFVICYTNFVNVEHIGYMNDHPDSGREKSRLLEHMTEEQIMGMLLADAEHINLFVESIQKIPREIANIMGLQKFRLEEISIIQHSILKNCPELYGMAVAFEPYMFIKDKRYFSSYLYQKDGVIIETDLDDPLYDYFSQNWYLLPKIMQEPVWTSPAYDEGGGEAYMTTFSVPFDSFDGEKEIFSGVVTIDVSIDWLVHHFPRNKELPNNGIVTLIAEDGTILSSRNAAWVLNETIFSLSESLKLPELRAVGRAIQRGEHGIRKIYAESYNRYLKLYYTDIKADKWGLLYLIPETPFVEPDEEKQSADAEKGK